MPRRAPNTPETGHKTLPATPNPPKGGTILLSGNPNTDPAAATCAHTVGLAATVHANGLHQRLGKLMGGVDYAQSSVLHAEDVFTRMAPTDPVEEMLVAQLIAAHTRAMHLADQAMGQTTPGGIRILNEYTDRAANTVRRLALALSDYRRPPRASSTNIGQANIAANQMVVNVPEGGPGENTTNEQGFDHADAETASKPGLLPESEGDRLTAGDDPADEAVEAVHRAQDG